MHLASRLNTYIGLDRMAKNDYTVYRRYKVKAALSLMALW